MTTRGIPKFDHDLRAAIVAGLGAGLSSDEVAVKHGVSPRRVRRYIEALGMAGLKPHQRQFTFRCSSRVARMLRQLAREAGDSPAKKIEQIISVMLDDGLQTARRRLGKIHRIAGANDGDR